MYPRGSKRHKSIDPDVFAVDNMTEPAWGSSIGPGLLRKVHTSDKCAGRSCVIHSPSEHHMSSWPLTWRADKYMMERMCAHGVGHPDPDDMVYHRSQGNDWKASHGCDGCCAPPESKGE